MEIAALAATVVAVLSATSLVSNAGSFLRRHKKLLVAVPTAVALLALGLPFVYTRFVIGPPPKPLTFEDLPVRAAEAVVTQATDSAAATAPAVIAPTTSSPSAGTDTGPLAGRWKVGVGSQAGYSIDDTVLGQTSRVVGRTTEVSGEAMVEGLSGISARVVVDMASVMCHCVHDDKYREMLEVDKFPTSTFGLTSPVSVSEIPPPGTVVTIPVNGRLTIHGVTRDVSFPLKATQMGERIAVNGSIPVDLEDYEIENPDAGAFGGLSNAAIDLLLAFDRG